MKRYYPMLLSLLSMLALLGLACSLTESAARVAQPTASPQPTPAATATQSDAAQVIQPAPPQPTPSPTPLLCRVTTGLDTGVLTLRSGPGIDYRALAYLSEGKTLTIIQPTPAAAAWLHVQAGDITGWVYAKFLECKP